MGHSEDPGWFSESSGKPTKEDELKMAALQLPCWNGVGMPRWKQGGKSDSYGSGTRRNDGGTDWEVAVGMLTGGPG